MVSIAGSKKLKRQMAPLFWGITRKNKRFVITVRPGSHPKEYSIPTAVLLRDTLKVVSTLREAKSTIYGGKVTIDGIKRKSLHHSIGLMDVVELENVPEVYRLVPKDGQILQPLKIDQAEKTKKLSKVTSKTSIKGGKTQLGFHDGRSMISDTAVNVGDSCLLELPKAKILDIIKLEQGCQVIVTRGINAGQMGTVEKIEKGTFRLPRRVLLALGERKIEIPTEMVMVVGKDKPVIKVGE
ncbi:MAG TPA: 30S ribosomal protein S4e [Nitrosopumilaceae archaeon]|nr:30S ribosomal protein S4e [Nitrosopumilaceae archaeon]